LSPTSASSMRRRPTRIWSSACFGPPASGYCPSLMTAAAAGLGFLPLAAPMAGRGSELESPMAIIVVGGLVTSTTLNMLVLPTIYVWLARRARRRGAVP